MVFGTIVFSESCHTRSQFQGVQVLVDGDLEPLIDVHVGLIMDPQQITSRACQHRHMDIRTNVSPIV